MTKFKRGDQVRRVKETYQGMKPGDVATVVSLRLNLGCVVLDRFGGDNGYGHDIKNLELVTEGGEMNKPYQRKTYKLLKDSPMVSKGALFQEDCDDGTQPYSLITKEHIKGSVGGKHSVMDRSLIEDQPTWFTEVFKVTPEYMTQAELDEWEAFKNSKKPAARRRTPAKKVAKKN